MLLLSRRWISPDTDGQPFWKTRIRRLQHMHPRNATFCFTKGVPFLATGPAPQSFLRASVLREACHVPGSAAGVLLGFVFGRARVVTQGEPGRCEKRGTESRLVAAAVRRFRCGGVGCHRFMPGKSLPQQETRSLPCQALPSRDPPAPRTTRGTGRGGGGISR